MVVCLRRKWLRAKTDASAAKDLRRVRAAHSSLGKLSAALIPGVCCDFPRRATLPLADLLSFHRRREPGPASGRAQEAVAAPASEAARVSATTPWHGRLRSSSALSLTQDAEEERGRKLSAAATVGSSGARSSGEPAVPPPYVERLFIPIVRPRAISYPMRKGSSR